MRGGSWQRGKENVTALFPSTPTLCTLHPATQNPTCAQPAYNTLFLPTRDVRA